MSNHKEKKEMMHDLGNLDAAWQGFVIRGGLMYTPNGYFYPPGYIYSIPIRMQQISNLERELETPKQLLL